MRSSQDYTLLKKEGVGHLENLAHEVWTDYNVHDPGITMLELICYGITDLGFRTDFDIKDLLTKQENGRPVNNSTFHTARDIFTCNPVTFNDLRKLLIDITGVRNAWIEKHKSVVYCLDEFASTLLDCPGPPGTVANDPLNGLYDVFIEYDEAVEDTRTVLLGLQEKQAAGGGYILADGRGIQFRATWDAVLKAVSVDTDANNTEITIQL
ncbi:MAG TPA: hypothetical protein VKP65_10355, partial [Rhodothermales bacterium]|nr:hypothetical protein [Rhodothermales bacterium]